MIYCGSRHRHYVAHQCLRWRIFEKDVKTGKPRVLPDEYSVSMTADVAVHGIVGDAWASV